MDSHSWTYMTIILACEYEKIKPFKPAVPPILLKFALITGQRRRLVTVSAWTRLKATTPRRHTSSEITRSFPRTLYDGRAESATDFRSCDMLKTKTPQINTSVPAEGQE